MRENLKKSPWTCLVNHLALQLAHQFAGDGFVLRAAASVAFKFPVTVVFSLGLGLWEWSFFSNWNGTALEPWNPGTLEPAVGLLSWVNLLSGLWRKANFNSNSYWNCLELLDLEILVVFVCDVLSKYTWNDMIKLRCPHLSHQQLQSSLPYPSVYLMFHQAFPTLVLNLGFPAYSESTDS